jgi:hypothetical protein
MGQRTYPFDIQTLLKDAGLIAASAAAQVGGVAAILDVGAARIDAVAVIDVTAVEIGTGDEDFTIIIQGSSSSSFASNIQNLAMIDVGANSSGRPGGAIDSLVGRYELLFTNEQADVTYRYIRAYTKVAGTIATGVNYTAFVTELPDR